MLVLGVRGRNLTRLIQNQGFFEAKLPSDANTDDIEVLLSRAWKDPCCHAAFAQVVMKVRVFIVGVHSEL